MAENRCFRRLRRQWPCMPLGGTAVMARPTICRTVVMTRRLSSGARTRSASISRWRSSSNSSRSLAGLVPIEFMKRRSSSLRMNGQSGDGGRSLTPSSVQRPQEFSEFLTPSHQHGSTIAAGRLLDGVEHNGMPEVRHG